MAAIRLAPILLALVPACGDDAASAPDATPGTTVTLTTQGGDPLTAANADFVAFQDGDGPWSVLTGTDGHYEARVTSGRYGFLVACSSALGGGQTSIQLSTTDESTAMTGWSCAPSAPRPLTISGTVTNRIGEVDVDSLGGFGVVEEDDTYTLQTRPGPEQLLVSEFRFDTFAAGRMVRRDLGTVTVDRVVDVDLTEGLFGTTVTPTVTGFTAADIDGFSSSDVYTGGGSLALPFVDIRFTPPAYLLLDPSQRLVDDRVEVTMFVYRGTFDDEGPYASRIVSISDVTPTTTFALPEVRTFPPPAVAGSTLTWALPAQSLVGDEQLIVSAMSFAGTGLQFMMAWASPGWAAEPRTVRLGGMPELAGWDPAWSLAGETNWDVIVRSAVPGGDWSSGTSGTVRVGASVAGPSRSRAEVHAARRRAHDLARAARP